MQRFLTQAQALASAATLATTLLVAPAPAQAQSTPSTQYNFTRIADIAGPLASLTGQVSLNNNGTVAFRATLDAGGTALFTGNGDGPLTTIAATTAAGGQFFNLNTLPSINDAGAVAFDGFPTTAGSSVFLSSGGRLTTVAASGSAGGPFQFRFFSGPTINEQGQVAFQASTASQPSGIYVADTGSGQITTVATSSQVGTEFGLGVQPSLNNRGQVAFTGSRAESLPSVLFLGGSSGVPPVRLADNTGPIANFGPPALNDAGVVAFQASLDAGGNGLFTLLDGRLTTLGDGATSPLVGFSDPSINNAGRVAFQALARGGGNASAALFTAPALPSGVPNLLAGRVIGVGDALDGSTVALIDSVRPGFNDRGQVAFWAQLADGRRGIYRANPTSLAEVIPEPSTLALAAVGAGLAGVMAVRQQRRQR